MSMSRVLSYSLIGGTVAAAVIYLLSTNKTAKCVKRKNLSGLYNMGNTCYANALIQGLSSLPSMVSWLRRLHCDESGDTRFVSQLRSLILELDAVNGETLSAFGVSQALIQHGWTLGYGVEQDLHELLNVFLTTWEEELAGERHRATCSSLLDVASLVKEEETGRVQKAFERCCSDVRLHAEMRAPCSGITATQLKCAIPECSFKKVRHDSFSVIPLTIPKGLRGMKLQVETLLRDYFRVEYIRGATCDACNLRTGRKDSGLLKRQGMAKIR